MRSGIQYLLCIREVNLGDVRMRAGGCHRGSIQLLRSHADVGGVHRLATRL